MPSPSRSRWERAGLGLWLLLAIAIAARLLFADPRHNNVYLKVFAPAAQAFADGRPLYGADSGFRYPPLCAALLWPFALVGPVLGSIAWRALNLAVLWAGVRAVLRRRFPFALDSRERGVFLLLLAVSTVVSLNNGQPNVLILGLLLLAAAAALGRRDAASATAVAASAAIKVYPLAYGLVLAVRRARQWAWLPLLLLLGFGLPFALQSPQYVLEQYRSLWATLAEEDRTANLAQSYRDLRLLAAAFGAPMPALLFHALQATLGAGIVALGWRLRRRGVDTVQVAHCEFSLTMCWFMLLGPATEKSTYALLGPTLAWGLLLALRQQRPQPLAAWAAANLLLLLSHVAEPIDRTQQAQHPLLRCWLPAAAVIAALALLGWARAQLRGRRQLLPAG